MRFPRKAMVLAAGLGTRLRPLTDATPKALLEIGGRPMIEYPLRMLARAGVDEVVVNLHHLAEQVRAALGDGSRYGLRIHYSAEDPVLDTGGAIARARPLLDGEPFAVANCDALLDPDLAAAWSLHQREDALVTLVVREDPEAERYGALDLDPTGRVKRLLGQPAQVSGPFARRMFCGIHLVSPRLFAHMPTRAVFSITRDVYAALVRQGAPIFGFDHRGYWRDLGTPPSLHAARDDLERGRFLPSFVDTVLTPRVDR
jgi:NDP-sugar pyrophosphorylase family protein